MRSDVKPILLIMFEKYNHSQYGYGFQQTQNLSGTSPHLNFIGRAIEEHYYKSTRPTQDIRKISFVLLYLIRLLLTDLTRYTP